MDLNAWLVPTILAMVCWSAAGLLPKLGEGAPPGQKAALIAVGTAVYAAFSNAHLGLEDFTSLPTRTLVAVTLAGVASGLGMAFYQEACQKGDLSAVTALSGLYPALTFVVSVVAFGEAVTLWKALGLVMALGSGLCFAM